MTPHFPFHQAVWLLLCPLAVHLLPFENCSAQATNSGRSKSPEGAMKSREALVRLIEASAKSPQDAGLHRTISKHYTQMIPESDSKAEKRELAGKAVTAAEEAVRLGPDDAGNRLTLAIALGRAAQLESPRAQVEMSRRIQEEAALATRLNPKEDYAWHVLGRWNYELANFNPLLKSFGEIIYGKFPDATNEKAAECFRTAIAVGPPRVIHHVEYGRTLLALGKPVEARQHLEKGLSLTASEPEDEESKRQARKLLEGL